LRRRPTDQQGQAPGVLRAIRTRPLVTCPFPRKQGENAYLVGQFLRFFQEKAIHHVWTLDRVHDCVRDCRNRRARACGDAVGAQAQACGEMGKSRDHEKVTRALRAGRGTPNRRSHDARSSSARSACNAACSGQLEGHVKDRYSRPSQGEITGRSPLDAFHFGLLRLSTGPVMALAFSDA